MVFVKSWSRWKAIGISMSSVHRQRELPSARPGTFIRAAAPRLSRSCGGTIASAAAEDHASSTNAGVHRCCGLPAVSDTAKKVPLGGDQFFVPRRGCRCIRPYWRCSCPGGAGYPNVRRSRTAAVDPCQRGWADIADAIGRRQRCDVQEDDRGEVIGWKRRESHSPVIGVHTLDLARSFTQRRPESCSPSPQLR